MESSEVGLVSVLFFFLPMLCVILLRPRNANKDEAINGRPEPYQLT